MIAPARTHAPTDRQLEVLDAIRRFIYERGYPPSIRDLCDLLAVTSKNGIVGHLKALERKGLLVHDPMIARGLRPVGGALPRGVLRVLGQVSAGDLIEAIEVEELLDLCRCAIVWVTPTHAG
jgi:repressor LexA